MPAPAPPRRLVAPLLAAAGLLLLLGGLDGTAFRGLYDDVDRALIARNMADSGDWLVPEYLGRPLPTKPPLMYWCAGSLYRLTGRRDELPARLPSVAGMAVLVLGTVHLGRRLRDRRTGLLAGAFLLTMWLFLAMARQPLIDTVMLAGLGTALVAVAELLRGPPARRTRWWLLLAASFAWSVMTKGPVLLPVLLLILAPRLRGPDAVRPTRRQGLLMLLVLAALTLPYPAALLAAAPDAAAVWRTELLGRFTGSSAFHEWTQKPWWFYGPDLVNTAPWLLLWPAGLAWAWRRRRGDTLAAVLLWWAAGGLLFFTLASATKRSYYLLPLYPAFALLAADLVRGLETRAAGFPRRLAAGALAGTALLVPAAVGAAAWGAARGDVGWVWPALIAGAAGAGLAVERRPVRALPGPGTLIAAAAALLLAYHWAVVPPAHEYFSGRPFHRAARARVAARPDLEVTVGGAHVAMTDFYLDPVRLRSLLPRDVPARAAEGRAGWLVTKPEIAAGAPELDCELMFTLTAPITGQTRSLGLYRFPEASPPTP